MKVETLWIDARPLKGRNGRLNAKRSPAESRGRSSGRVMAFTRSFFLWDKMRNPTFTSYVCSETMPELNLSRFCPSIEDSLRRCYFLFEQDL